MEKINMPMGGANESGQDNFPIEKKPEKEKSFPGVYMYFFRHSMASYATYKDILKSENPQAPVDRDNQSVPDLPEKGVELARQKALEFFQKGNLDPQRDAFVFYSSDEARALETANIFRKVARELGFEIIQHARPENSRKNPPVENSNGEILADKYPGNTIRHRLAREIGEGEIRTLRTLSLNIKNTLLGSIFNPDKYMGEINMNAIDSETRGKWDKAREVINADDKGSWGANFFHHSEAIQKIFPEIKSSRDLWFTTFQELSRMAEFGIRKAVEAKHPKNVHIMNFGHENYVGYALDKYLGDHPLGNCENIEVNLDENNLSMKRPGDERQATL